MDLNVLKTELDINELYNKRYLIWLNDNLDKKLPKYRFRDLMQLYSCMISEGINTKLVVEFDEEDYIETYSVSDDFSDSEPFLLSEYKNESTQNAYFQIEFLKTSINVGRFYKLIDELGINETGDDTSLIERKCFDDRVCMICRLIYELAKEDGTLEDRFISFSNRFKKCLDITLEKDGLDEIDLEIIIVYCQIIRYILHKSAMNENMVDFDEEAIAYISFFISEYYAEKTNVASAEALFFAKRSLNINDPEFRYEAFSSLGDLATQSNKLQLSNDVFASWIEKNIVGAVCELIGSEIDWSKEDEWRSSDFGKKCLAQMYCSLAYTRTDICDTYKKGTKPWKDFYTLALKEIEKAEELDPYLGVYHSTHGCLLEMDIECDFTNPKEVEESIKKLNAALSEYIQYMDFSLTMDNLSEKLCSTRVCCEMMSKIIYFETIFSGKEYSKNVRIKENVKKLKEYADQYFSLPENYYGLNRKTDDEMRLRNESKIYLSLYNEIEDEQIFNIYTTLLAIHENTECIKDHLNRTEYLSTDYYTRKEQEDYTRSESAKVAYYTTLRNVTHLFENLYLDDGVIKVSNDSKHANTKNCLTVMNAKYMNDPNEGAVILKELTNNLVDNCLFPEKNARELLDEIFDENFIFLKSFTEQIDTLLMWSRYASDYTCDGYNSNGCCVVVDPECFVGETKITECEGLISIDNDIDDYTLYRIVYVKQNGSIDITNNPGLDNNVIVLYYQLKELIAQLNDNVRQYLVTNPEDSHNVRNRVKNTLKKSLLNILFLFKYDDYADEVESRMILYRDKNTQNDIRVFPGNPPMLAINPFFQVNINKIILGPNVRDVEKWRPYFQYQLNDMWQRHWEQTEKKYNSDEITYTITQSNIKYRT